MANAAQSNYASDPNAVNPRDQFGTPAYATELIVPWLKRAGVQTIWESAAGKHKFIYNHLTDHGFIVAATDLLDGPQYNRFTFIPPFKWDAEVTNPPYGRGVKFQYCDVVFASNTIAALLLPTAFHESKTGQMMMKQYGLQVLIPDDRIDFHTPYQGWNSSAQFHSSWFCKGLDLPDRFYNVKMNKPPRPKSAVPVYVCTGCDKETRKVKRVGEHQLCASCFSLVLSYIESMSASVH